MRLLKAVIAMFCLVFLAGCTFQSSAILPDARAAGDPIAGFPTDTPFKLESFDRQNKSFHYIGTVTPQPAADGRILYKMVFAGDSKTLQIQAKKLADERYVLRYLELDGDALDMSTSALVFVTRDKDVYYVLTSLADKKLFEKAFEGGSRPSVVNDAITFDSEEQGAHLSAYFTNHRAEFLTDQDYVRMRLMK